MTTICAVAGRGRGRTSQDGSTLLVSGFGMAGMPVQLVDALIDQGATDLTVVSNNAGNGDTGLAALLAAGRVRKSSARSPGSPTPGCSTACTDPGRIELEVVPQGTLAERLRAAGAGIPAFFCPTGAGTLLSEGKETREIDGRLQVLEYALPGDVALVGAHVARPDGERGLPQDRAELRPGHGHRRPHHDRPGRPRRRHGPARPRGHRHAVDLRRPHRRRGRRDHEPGQRARWPPPSPGTSRRAPSSTSASGSRRRSPSSSTPASGVVLHTENGMLNMGPAAVGDQVDPDLTNAGKVPVTELPGCSYFNHAESFAMMRGGHLDVCVLGAFQVSAARRPRQLAHGRARCHPGGGWRDGPRDRRQARVRDDDAAGQGRHAEARARSARTR